MVRQGSLLRIGIALAVAFAALASLAVPASAECSNPLPPQTINGYRGYGFEAVVRSAGVAVTPEDAPPKWEVSLDVTRVYRGAVPDELVIEGYSYEVTCGNFHGEFLKAGDRLLVTTDRLSLRHHDFGLDVLVWRLGSSGWAFDNRIVNSHDAANRFIPAAARHATTRTQIVALITGGLPDTETARALSAPTSASLGLGFIVGVGVAAAFLRRRTHAARTEQQ